MGVLQGFLNAAAGQLPLSSSLGRWAQRASTFIEQLVLYGRPFITQTEWYVDADNGNDANGGSSWADALQTPAQLGLRFYGVFDPSATVVNVYLRGTFSEPLTLHSSFTRAEAVVTIRGELSTLHEGTVTTYTAFAPVTDVRASLAETGTDLSTFVGKRIQITSGLVEGAVTHIAASSGQAGLIGQFSRVLSSGSVSTSNPANGSAYVVEDYETEIPAFDIDITGARTVLRDLRIHSTSDTSTIRSHMHGSFGALASCNIFGCEFVADVTTNLGGNCSMASCLNTGGPLSLGAFFGRMTNHVAMAYVGIGDGSFVVGFANLHQGASASLSISTGATLEDISHRAMFGVGGSVAFDVASMGRYLQLHSIDLLWGSGNTAGATVRVQGPSQFAYLGKPTIAGTGTDALVGGVAKTWAQIPYIDIGAGTNESGAMLVLQQ
jgi:hypothetical protein